ncbi:MAG: AtpZ/AtpI family protein [Pseudomonadota bacterium]
MMMHRVIPAPASEVEPRQAGAGVLDDEGRRMMKDAGRLGAVGFEIVICLLLGYFGGHWLDGKLGSDPYLAMFGLLVGLAAAGKVIHRIIKQTDLDKL